MAITREFVRSVRERLAENPGLSTAKLARELGSAEANVLMAMPVSMRRRARPEDMKALCSHLAGFGRMPDDRVCGKDVGSIWFVARSAVLPGAPGQGSVRFMDKEGRRLGLIPLREKEFLPLWERFGVKDVPPKKRCGSSCDSCPGRARVTRQLSACG